MLMSIGSCDDVCIVASGWSVSWAFMFRTCEKNIVPRISVMTAWNISTALPHFIVVKVVRSL